MINSLSGVQKQLITQFLGGIILASVLLFPPVVFKKGIPAIELLDVLIPLLLVYIFLLRKDIFTTRLIALVGIFCAVVFLSIVVNSRITQIRDYFEFVKLVKFAVVLTLFSWIQPQPFMKQWLKPLFIALTIFNLIHFLDLFQFNHFLDQFYLGNGRYLQFGLDSAGMPTYKRMLGFAGNPNNNAFIFGVFMVFFLPKKDSPKADYIFLFISVIMLFLCQSRTAMVATALMLPVYAVLNLAIYRRVLAGALTVLLGFGMAFLVTKKSVSHTQTHIINANGDTVLFDPETGLQEYTYLESVVHGEFTQGASMKGRYEIWNHLWQMIRQKPLLGHAPYKEYFYDNGLYAENEFILTAWRYGFIGLGIYLIILLYLTIQGLKNRSLAFAQNLILTILIFVITSMTNNPFANKTALVLVAIVIGLFYNEQLQQRKKSASSLR